MRKFTAEEFDEKTAFFDGMARSRWFYELQEELCVWHGSFTAKEVLDVGCGTGRLLIRKSDFCRKAVGVDISSRMIEAAKELADEKEKSVLFYQADAENMFFADNSFDTVLCTCVLFLMPEPEKMASEICRVLRPGGSLALLNPAPDFTQAKAEILADRLPAEEKPMMIQWGKVSEKRHRFSEVKLKEILRTAGFSSVESRLSINGLGLLTSAVK